MNYAAVMMRKKNKSISQIAISLGYHNASKFSKAFRDVIGVLLKDYCSAVKINEISGYFKYNFIGME